MAIIGVADPESNGARSRSTAVKRRIISVTNNENTALRKHSKFWDKKNKGYITPVDTAAGFMNLGYGVVFSLTIGTFMGIFLAYATQDSWIPDPRCRINIRKLTSPPKRHSHSRVYDEYGQFDPERFEALFDKYAQSDLSGSSITLTELLQMAGEQGSYGASPTAWTTALFEWMSLYILIGKGGTFKKSEIQAAYDGTLFYQIRETRRPLIQAAAIDSSTGHLLKQNAIRTFERHLSTAVEHLPEAIVRNFVPVDSVLGGNVVATPVQQRRHMGAEHIPGTKTISLGSQSFSLTGVQGYTYVPSISSEDDLDVPDLVSEQSDSSDLFAELSTLTGLRPDGADFYRDTPLTNWIGGQLSGVKKSTAGGEPLIEDDTIKNYGVQLTGVKNKRASPLTDWLVEDHKNDTKKPVVEFQPVILTGTVRSSETSTDASSLSDDNNKKVRFEAVPLSGTYHDDAQSKTMQSVPIVQAPSPVDKDLNFDLEPVTLSGLRHDDITSQEEKKGLAIVNAPTLFDFAEVDLESYKQPVFLTGLAPQKISDERAPLSIVEAPSRLFKRDYGYTMEPVALTGVNKEDEIVKSRTISIVNAPASFEHDDTLLTAAFTSEPADADHEPPQPVSQMEPVLLTGLRSTDTTYATFVEAPTNLKHKETAAFEPVSLSGLRSTDVEPATFVEVPDDFVEQEYQIEPVLLSGLRSVDTTPATFVEVPANFVKEEYKIEAVSLSGLNAKNEVWGQVEEPEWYKPKKTTELEPVKLSGVQSEQNGNDRWITQAKEKQRRSSFDQPLLDSELDAVIKWREGAGFKKEETDVDLVWRWREQSGFNTHLPPLEAFELCGVKTSSNDIFDRDFPIVEDPFPSAHVEMPFESCPIDMIGLSGDPEERLKNHLNTGCMSGVQKSDLYEDPIELPEEVQEQVDYELYRRALPLSGIQTMEENAVKNWLNTGTLPGVNQSVSIYEAAGDLLPNDYIEPRPKDDYDDVGRLVAGISRKAPRKPLKNWLNTKSLPFTESSKLYQEAQPDPEPVEMDIDLDQYRAPFPLSGLHGDEIKYKNWLNNDNLPGVQSSSMSSYQKASSSMPEDYIEPRDPSFDDDSKALEGLTSSASNLRLKNWLSTTDLPGVQSGDRVYDEAKELSPSEYIESSTESQELPADFKLTGVALQDDLPELEAHGLTPPKMHHDSEDEHSIATESTMPAPTSPSALKKGSPSSQKLAMASGNWSAMSDIASLKEE